MASTRGHRVQLDINTYTSSELHVVAWMASGAIVAAVDHVMDLASPGLCACPSQEPPR